VRHQSILPGVAEEVRPSGELVPEIDAAPHRCQSRRLRSRRLFRLPRPREPRSKPSRQRVDVIQPDVGSPVVEGIQIDVLPDDLALRLELPAIPEINGVAALIPSANYWIFSKSLGFQVWSKKGCLGPYRRRMAKKPSPGIVFSQFFA